MTQHPALRTSLFLLCLSVASVAFAQTQAPAKPFEPQVGQAGKDVVWVPTPQALVDKIHRHAYKVTDDDISRAQAEYGDDQLFEIIVSASLGASRQRLLASLKALEEA